MKLKKQNIIDGVAIRNIQVSKYICELLNMEYEKIRQIINYDAFWDKEVKNGKK